MNINTLIYHATLKATRKVVLFLNDEKMGENNSKNKTTTKKAPSWAELAKQLTSP